MDWLTGLWPLAPALGAFAAAAALIAAAGSALARVVDRLADRTGLGEAVAGMVMLAAATSLAGLVTSIVAASSGEASLAISNSMGGIAAQTTFLVVADLLYRGVNLEHAAASLANLLNALAVVALVAIVIAATAAPAGTILDIHPASVLLFIGYLYAVRLGRLVSDRPMWKPRVTSQTRPDEPERTPPGERLAGLWGRFALLAILLAAAGWVVARSGLSIVESTALSGTFVGAFATSVATSLPELVTTIAAVRAGALTLAVGGVIGGNAFDVTFVAAADVAYRDGSLYAQATSADVFVLGWVLLLTAILGAGLLVRERRGIGFEGVAIILVYLVGFAAVWSIG